MDCTLCMYSNKTIGVSYRERIIATCLSCEIIECLILSFHFCCQMPPNNGQVRKMSGSLLQSSLKHTRAALIFLNYARKSLNRVQEIIEIGYGDKSPLKIKAAITAFAN